MALPGHSLQDLSHEELKATCEALTMANATLFMENARLKNALDLCHALRDEMHKEVEALRASAHFVDALQAQVRQLEEQNRILQEENTALKKALEEMQATLKHQNEKIVLLGEYDVALHFCCFRLVFHFLIFIFIFMLTIYVCCRGRPDRARCKDNVARPGDCHPSSGDCHPE